MKAKRLLALFLGIVLSSAVGFAQGNAKTAVRQKTFEKTWQIVNDKFWDPTFGGVDWKAVHDRYASQVAVVKTDDEFYELLGKMLGELKTSHMQVIRPEQIAKLKTAPTFTGISFRQIDSRIVIVRVITASSAAEAGIKPGFVITQVDGVAVSTIEDVKKRLAGALNSTVKLTYLDANEMVHEATLERRALAGDDNSKLAGMKFYALFDSQRLENNIGYFRFSSFLDFLNPRIRDAVGSMSDAPGIIIDLRGNSGGDDSVALKMASLFFDKDTQLMITKPRKGDNFEYKAKASKQPYRGKVVILLDELSMSASEEFAAGMQAAGRAVVVGRQTPGSDMDGELEQLPDGSVLLYAHGQTRTPKGYIVEGHGVKPDIEVALTREGLLAGHDAQLEAAAASILKK